MDRLNEWHIIVGKNNINILEYKPKKAEYCTDIDTYVKFIHDYFPDKIDCKKCVLFIYSDVMVHMTTL